MASDRIVRASSFAVGRTPRQRRLERTAKAVAIGFIAAGCVLLGLSLMLS